MNDLGGKLTIFGNIYRYNYSGGQLKYVLFSPQKIGEDDFPNLTNPHNFCSDGLVFKTTN